MAKPHIHAKNSAKRWGGTWEEYEKFHILMDESKQFCADSRHRALTHNSWFIWICEKIWGTTYINSVGATVSVRDILEQHILEDFGMKYIPTPQDYLQAMDLQSWMVNGQHGVPPSYERIEKKKVTTTIDFSQVALDARPDKF